MGEEEIPTEGILLLKEDNCYFSLFHDGYKERIEALIKSKMKGEVAHVKEMTPKKPVANSMREALRETAESLK